MRAHEAGGKRSGASWSAARDLRPIESPLSPTLRVHRAAATALAYGSLAAFSGAGRAAEKKTGRAGGGPRARLAADWPCPSFKSG